MATKLHVAGLASIVDGRSRPFRLLTHRHKCLSTNFTTSAFVVILHVVGLTIFAFAFATCSDAPTSAPIVPTSAAIETITVSNFPLALNNIWVYQSTRYEAVPVTEMITATSTITETVVDTETSASYFAAKIRRDVSTETLVFVSKSRQGESLRPAESSEYWLVAMGNQLYHQESNVGHPNLGDRDSREFVFPLKPRDRWYLYEAKDPHSPSGAGGIIRQVVQVDTRRVPAGQFDHCLL
jgi:hypothetical protein